MSMPNIQVFWPDWELEEELGSGAYGRVYSAVHREHGMETRSAIKVISIPQSSAELESLRAEGMDETGTRTYLRGIVEDFENEIKAMISLKGVQNVVNIEDFKVVERQGEIGWDIYIRMELLTPLTRYTVENLMAEADVIRMGCDLCDALELCHQRNIIHRDVKPENIFVNDFGDFKLGDFGIARKLENMTGTLSYRRGTDFYMAPEVALSSDYDARADIYSLGLVLYRLMNKNRIPNGCASITSCLLQSTAGRSCLTSIRKVCET